MKNDWERPSATRRRILLKTCACAVRLFTHKNRRFKENWRELARLINHSFLCPCTSLYPIIFLGFLCNEVISNFLLTSMYFLLDFQSCIIKCKYIPTKIYTTHNYCKLKISVMWRVVKCRPVWVHYRLFVSYWTWLCVSFKTPKAIKLKLYENFHSKTVCITATCSYLKDAGVVSITALVWYY